jgi:hypothetical protein
VLEERAQGAAGGGAGDGLVAQGGGQRRRVLGHPQVAAVGAAGTARRDVGEHLGLEAVGAELAPHRDRDGVDQLLLGGVHGAVALLQVEDVLAPFGRVVLRQEAELPRAQAVAERVHPGARLALRRLRAALLGRGQWDGVGHGGGSGWSGLAQSLPCLGI